MQREVDDGMAHTVEVLDESSQLDGLRHDWDRLVVQSEPPSVYNSYAFNMASWRHYDVDQSQPAVITVRDGGELVGLAPLRIRRRRVGLVIERVVEPLGLAHADRSSVIARPGSEEAVWDLVLDTLKAMSWQQWTTSEVDTASIGHRKLREHFGPSDPCFELVSVEMSEALLTDISGTWDDFFASHKRMRRNLRSLAKAFPDYRMERYVTPDEVAHGLTFAEELAAKTWKSGKVGLLKSADTRRFYRKLVPALATDGYSGVRLLRDGDEIIASQIGFLCGTTAHFHATDYNPDYEKYSPGMMMVAHTIEDFFDSPATTVDYLTGYAGYMKSWATDTIVTEQFDIKRSVGRFSPMRPYHRLNDRLAHLRAGSSKPTDA
jgi:CelD/BcsL family acetyltransferase involved in cellulose biosynthesis